MLIGLAVSVIRGEFESARSPPPVKVFVAASRTTEPAPGTVFGDNIVDRQGLIGWRRTRADAVSPESRCRRRWELQESTSAIPGARDPQPPMLSTGRSAPLTRMSPPAPLRLREQLFGATAKLLLTIGPTTASSTILPSEVCLSRSRPPCVPSCRAAPTAAAAVCCPYCSETDAAHHHRQINHRRCHRAGASGLKRYLFTVNCMRVTIRAPGTVVRTAANRAPLALLMPRDPAVNKVLTKRARVPPRPAAAYC